MNDVLTVSIGNNAKKVFMKSGFKDATWRFSPLHSHHYGEMHIICDGELSFFIKDKEYVFSGGNIVILPPRVFHSVRVISDESLHFAFQLDLDLDEFKTVKISNHIIKDFFNELKISATTEIFATVSSYIALFCSKALGKTMLNIEKLDDPGYTICEFFSNHYNEDIKVSDLAKVLSFSEKQTERLVLKYTGKTFKQELVSHRMEMARYLEKHTTMTMTEIAEYVGYKSYNGFWKAYKK